MRLPPSFIAAVGTLLLRLLAVTWRLRLHDHAGLRQMEDKPRLIALWHCSLLPSPFVYRWFRTQRELVALASASKDGRLIADILDRLGIGNASGSSSKQGSQGARQMLGAFKAGKNIAITPDGPRGPAGTIQQGVLRMAKKMDADIVPLRFVIRGSWRVKSWDRMHVPLPFARIDVHIDRIIHGRDDGAEDTLRESLGPALPSPGPMT